MDVMRPIDVTDAPYVADLVEQLKTITRRMGFIHTHHILNAANHALTIESRQKLEQQISTAS